MKAAFSRPVTAAVIEENAEDITEDDDISIDEVLITQLREALADSVSGVTVTNIVTKTPVRFFVDVAYKNSIDLLTCSKR